MINTEHEIRLTCSQSRQVATHSLDTHASKHTSTSGYWRDDVVGDDAMEMIRGTLLIRGKSEKMATVEV